MIPMDYGQYDAWSENARLARMEYLKGKLAAEEFLQRIDTTHELGSYEADKAELVEEMVWQRRGGLVTLALIQKRIIQK